MEIMQECKIYLWTNSVRSAKIVLVRLHKKVKFAYGAIVQNDKNKNGGKMPDDRYDM